LLAYVWGPVAEGEDPGELIRGIVQRLLDAIERSPWVPSTWMREILNEGGLLRTRILRRLPYEKLQIVGAAIARGQAAQTLNPDVDPRLVVFSTLGLVMVHMATIRVWADVFHSSPPSPEAIRRHITGLLLDGLRGNRSAASTGELQVR
jgi:TetR/AcrR family transcriptional regulator